MPERHLIAVPTLNEAGNIDPLLRVLLDKGATDLFIIDDGSTDGTLDKLAAWQERYPDRLSILQRGRRLGLGTALIEAYRYTLAQGYDRLLQLDADLSHDPRSAPALLHALDLADLAIGSRYVPGGRTVGWPRHRYLLSRTASTVSRRLAGVPVADITSGFRAFRRTTLERLEPDSLHATGFSIQVETTTRAHRLGMRLVEVPITFRERRAGASKMDLDVLLEWGRLVWSLRASQAGRQARATR